MKNERIEELISKELDGELDAAGESELRDALDADPELADVRDDFVNIGRMMREADMPETKSPEAAWQDVRREIRALPESRPKRVPWKWAWGFATACAVVLAVFFRPDGSAPAIAGNQGTTVEFVVTELDDAMTIVNVDPQSGVTVIWIVDVENDDEG